MAMANILVVVAVKAANGQAVILDNGLDAWIGRVQSARVAGVVAGRVVAHGATAGMKGGNAICARPGVGE